MYTLEIDFKELEELKKQLEHITDTRLKNFSDTVNLEVELLKVRIGKGMTSDYRLMETKSTKREGRYSSTWAKARKKKGLKVDVVNLEFTGDTKANFKRKTSGLTEEIDVGFTDTKAEGIAAYNNEMFGPAYDFSDKAIDGAFEDYLFRFDSPLLK